MNQNEILQKVKKFYNDEIKQVKRSLKNPFRWDKKELVNNAIQRGLGIAFFVQYLDMPYKDIDIEYEKFKEEMYKILENGS